MTAGETLPCQPCGGIRLGEQDTTISRRVLAFIPIRNEPASGYCIPAIVLLLFFHARRPDYACPGDRPTG